MARYLWRSWLRRVDVSGREKICPKAVGITDYFTLRLELGTECLERLSSGCVAYQYSCFWVFFWKQLNMSQISGL